ncbi:MAG: hexitol phosphatase HxpB [Flavobacteriales bacterium]|jgi:HAD superfamily hydrolase (TIGR01509 family)
MSALNPRQFKSVLFDMDGVLIDSEPMWKIAMEDVFSSLGSRLTKEDFQRTVGLRIDQVVSFWNAEESWGIEDPNWVVDQIIDQMIELVAKNPSPLPGVIETLDYLQSLPIKIGLATSSPIRLMQAVLFHMGLSDCFHTTCSAEKEPYGKPHPAVYLRAAEELSVVPQACLVIEDSLNGIISGKAAFMKVVCIPEKTHHPNSRLNLADFHYSEMTQFLDDFRAQWNHPNSNGIVPL